MKKNKIKEVLDSIILILEILFIVILKYSKNNIICLLLLISLAIVVIIERIYWRCSKCGEYLPRKSWFNKVICCPYCNANIDEK